MKTRTLPGVLKNTIDWAVADRLQHAWSEASS
jgi:NAD(P)H-dependent FMN reductase